MTMSTSIKQEDPQVKQEDQNVKAEQEQDELWAPEEEGAGPTRRRTRNQPKDPRQINFGKLLRPSRANRYTIGDLYSKLKDKHIDIEPEYQRTAVWPDSKSSALIESIYRHYYVPPILFSTRYDEIGLQKFTCIDGKQRITAIAKFIEGEIPVIEPVSNKRFWFKEYFEKEEDGKKVKVKRNPVIAQAQKQRFLNESITAVEYDDLTEGEERDMFSRVQMGVTLSTAEKLGAHLGPWPDFIRMLVKKYFDPSLDKVVIDGARSKSYFFMGQICMLIRNARSEKFLPSANHLNNFLSHSEDGPDDHFKEEVSGVFRRLIELASHETYGACLKPEKKFTIQGREMKKPLAPIEFVYAAYLVWKFKESATLSQLYQLIQGMKLAVRPQFKDVMFNTRTAEVIRSYIDTAPLPPRLPEDNETPTGKGKRKRRREVEDDDESYRPTPPRAAAHARRPPARLSPEPDAGLLGNGHGPGRS
ncbi:hypothetical protein IE53DRAFT_145980 [Violaceomyces palustris]|uniref:Uncharacterized protein n=1 Tax=Violaceomyces palustris TaxID=1673888 RepID=A0ACD0NUB0_9BASI|nr:hypothetical protein IE53DRAFT_145980 [Violaceomyces palustris]